MSVIQGKAYWASLINPNTTFDSDGTWSIDVSLDEKNKKIAEADGLTIKNKNDDRGDFVTIKRKVNAKNGKRPAPKLYNLNKEPMDITVGNGSAVKVQYNEFAWDYAGKSGVSLDFQAMQVLDLVPMKSQDGDELNPFGDGEEF